MSMPDPGLPHEPSVTNPKVTSMTPYIGVSNVYPITADYFNEEIKAAEQRGYQRAVENLRERAAVSIQVCEDSARDLDVTAAFDRTSLFCAQLSRLSAQQIKNIVEWVANHA